MRANQIAWITSVFKMDVINIVKRVQESTVSVIFVIVHRSLCSDIFGTEVKNKYQQKSVRMMFDDSVIISKF